MSMVNRITTAVWAVIGLVWLYFVSVPGGGTFLVIIALWWVVPFALFLYVVTMVLNVRDKALGRPHLWCHLIALALLLFSVTELPMRAHWLIMKPTFEEALVTDDCPSWAGFAPVDDCLKIDGNPSYYFGGGFIDHYEIAHVPDMSTLSPRHAVRASLGDDWYVIYVPFD
ncbi:hypothetical protein [Corynebacterium sp. H130]|uniref:hypothetical protein n=1 Tax=Corynebacterium sp. H130 TaxID=3133444 RepID=UPI0030A87363